MSSRVSSSSAGRTRRSRRVDERSRISLMDVFREAFKEQDGRAQPETVEEGGQAVARLSGRSNARRLGVDEDSLREHVRNHLATLMNSIRLDAAIDLSDAPNVAKSVLNYGFQDLSNLTRNELTAPMISQSIKQSLMDHEPRLVPNSIEVRVIAERDEQHQRVAVHVTADLIADPADIPVEFEADVDTGAGKVVLQADRI